MVFGNGGLYSYLGTKDFREACDRYRGGDPEAIQVVEAMAYQIAKEIGALSTVPSRPVDAILITGGMAYAEFFVELIRERVVRLAPVHVYAGEDEMQALAEGVCRVLSGQEPALRYPEG
jgi:butyrate kinase